MRCGNPNPNPNRNRNPNPNLNPNRNPNPNPNPKLNPNPNPSPSPSPNPSPSANQGRHRLGRAEGDDRGRPGRGGGQSACVTVLYRVRLTVPLSCAGTVDSVRARVGHVNTRLDLGPVAGGGDSVVGDARGARRVSCAA